MNAAAAIMQAEAAGVRLRLDGATVRVDAARSPPSTVLGDLRRHRDEVVALLAARLAGAAPARPTSDHDAPVRDPTAADFAAPPLPDPAAPDPLAAGLLRSAGQLPPSWSDPDMTPWPGAWCGCCGRHQRRGGRW